MTRPFAPSEAARDTTRTDDARIRQGLWVGGVGMLACLLGAWFDPARAAAAYLAAFMAGLGVALGALILVMISHVTGAKWFVVLRRVTENVAATLPVFALLFVPVVLAMTKLYPWAAPSASLDPHVATLIQKKSGYLNAPAFLLRAVVYFAVWGGLAIFLRRWSMRQDAAGDDAARAEALGARLRALSAGGLVAVGLTLTFAAVDWLASLSPEWYSSIFGACYFASAMVGALATVAVLGASARADGDSDARPNHTHFHAVGNLLLAFVMVWAYFGFSQLLIIWTADIPDEVSWYVPRVAGGWGVLALVVVGGHFVLPLLALLQKSVKRSPRRMAILGVWLLLMHWLEMYWFVVPRVAPGSAWPSWMDVAALLGVGGFAVAFGVWRRGVHPAVPIGDPGLPASLAYETT